MSAPNYRKRDRVRHAVLGFGTVTAYKPLLSPPTYCHECGAKLKPVRYGGSIVIRFDDHGSKELMLSFTEGRLKKVRGPSNPSRRKS